MATPSTPTRLTAIVILPTEVDFIWSSLGLDTAQYLIERSLNGSTWVQIATTPVTQTLYRNTGLAGSTTYYWRVRATDWTSYSDYSPILTVTTLATGIAGRLAKWVDTLHTGNSSLIDDVTGAVATLEATLTGSRVWTFPDRSGGVVLTPLDEHYSAAFGDSTPQVVWAMPAHRRLARISVEVSTIWNGTGAQILIGTAADADRFFAAGDTDLTELGLYDKEFDDVGLLTIQLTIAPGAGASQGAINIMLDTLET